MYFLVTAKIRKLYILKKFVLPFLYKFALENKAWFGSVHQIAVIFTKLSCYFCESFTDVKITFESCNLYIFK